MQYSLEDLEVIAAMTQYGGSFVKSLAVCFSHADKQNYDKLKTCFSEYWNEYQLMVDKMKEDGNEK